MIVFACKPCWQHFMPHPSPCGAIFTEAKAGRAITAFMASWVTSASMALAFCRIMQDGDDEGCLHLDRLPTPAEAVLIREALSIRKRRALTEGGRAQLDAARRAANSPSNPSFIEQNDRAATPPRETA